jgi:hypothetical protein
MNADWQKEIVELHEFFQGWLGGGMAPTEEEFYRLEEVLAEGFTLITPDGRHLERDPLLQGLRESAGARSGVRIWIEEPHLHHEGKTLLIASYQEWQQEKGSPRARVSTVVFRPKKALPNGVEWLHVHETWLGS